MLYFFISLVGITAILVVALGVERLSGARPAKSIDLNAICGVCQLTFTAISNTCLGPGVIWMVGRIGKPPIHLSGHGWMFPVSVLLMIALIDLVDYAFHRLEHRIPWLWAMHSFHHSDSTMNATTAYRHFWLDRALLSAALIPLGLLTHSDINVLVAVAVADWVLGTYVHLNVRVGLPRLSWLVVTPQFHRTHHSILQEHYDRNFAAFLPIWDVLFGTYLEPVGFPDTGLTEGEPRTIKDALLWAFRTPEASYNSAIGPQETPTEH